MATNPPASTAPPPPFELIDGYTVDKYISKGSYGEVYQGTRTWYSAQPNTPLLANPGDGSPTYLQPEGTVAGGFSAFNDPTTYSGSAARPIHQNHTTAYLGPAGYGATASAAVPSTSPSSLPIHRGGGLGSAVGMSSDSDNPHERSPSQGAARPSQYSGLSVGCAQQQQALTMQKQRVAIKLVRDYARRGTTVQGSDRYVTRYTKKIAREVQLLQYFNGCKEFVPVLDMYLSQNKHDLYIVMKLYDYSLYTFIRHEVAIKKQEEEEMRSPKKNRPENGGGATNGTAAAVAAPQQPPAPAPRKLLRRIMNEKQTKLLTVQLLSGLAKMAAVGSAHRDLSSGNVLYDPKTNRCAICDFGLSRANISCELAQTTNVVTAPYRSPELLLLVNRYDGEKVDVWSVGILIMEMLIGCPPVFEQNDNLQREGVFRNLCYCDMAYWMSFGVPNTLLENERGRKFDHYNKYPKFIERLASEHVLSPEGLDVLKSCLEQKPEDRKRCLELLQMPWFQRDDDAVRLIDELTAHADRDSAFKRRQLPNIEDGFGREDHIKWLESVVPKIATMKQPCPSR